VPPCLEMRQTAIGSLTGIKNMKLRKALENADTFHNPVPKPGIF